MAYRITLRGRGCAGHSMATIGRLLAGYLPTVSITLPIGVAELTRRTLGVTSLARRTMSVSSLGRRTLNVDLD